MNFIIELTDNYSVQGVLNVHKYNYYASYYKSNQRWNMAK